MHFNVSLKHQLIDCLAPAMQKMPVLGCYPTTIQVPQRSRNASVIPCASHAQAHRKQLTMLRNSGRACSRPRKLIRGRR